MNTLENVYEEYNRYIYHLCLKLTRNKAEAEDLMQEVWVKVVRYESYMAEVEHVKAWLTTIAMNTFRDRYRKNVRRSKYMMSQPETLDVPVLDLVPNNEPSTEKVVEQGVISQIVQEKIDQLDTIYRNTLLYFYVNQYSLVEIAGLMKVSIGTVKSRLFRAKQRLKEILMSDESSAEAILPA
ncbi:RNA polymerase sigma factor [Rummeliibacillus sp. G93]|mgnify:CR=1 FL=1|uniref:RNA polymerase subunit sigma-70 n=1 Tax=Rummeliibacillus stabekisii TaxID=241244 RepID=A0A143HGE4_9BACL|nr:MULTISPECIES: RNA polymerase sigma factor [Rummeliibacillus]AMX00794.1 RNA polymerase subunit sigma-70 [Rummeliibacillus stabekisii]MBB5170619.1 RNA polymerase sigma-70 factor (ECF subfamily) [Rummeliibacillus stabekisii]MCM3315108.1 RNA polymerase sigma factor [Rummeliibacillus stabekisii]UQW97637.1 RNA polymerase sigma factor [Rummeliibacillus sp. G93]GEL04875.1 RNA polymerase sigma factor [Rummeliibacillus stabekisii]